MEVKIINVELEVKDENIKQSDGKGFRKYLSEGYHVVGRYDGYTQLKRVRMNATIKQNDRIRVIDLRDALYSYYGTRRDHELIEKLTHDLAKESVGLKMDSMGYWKLFRK